MAFEDIQNKAWEHARSAIAAANISLEPFPHISVINIFPEPFYDAIIEHLPPTECYDFVTDDDYTVMSDEAKRGFIDFGKPEHFDGLPESYHKFWKGLSSPAFTAKFTNALVAKFQPYLQIPAEVITPSEPINTFGKWLLARDFPGYELLPHTDVRQKLLAGLFYLPRPGEETEFGTSFLRLHAGMEDQLKDSDRYPRKMFEEVVRPRFARNSFHAFARSDQSFHGVRPIGEEVVQRDILMFNVNVA